MRLWKKSYLVHLWLPNAIAAHGWVLAEEETFLFNIRARKFMSSVGVGVVQLAQLLPPPLLVFLSPLAWVW